MRRKRTIKAYVDLYHNPRAMFPGGPDSRSAEVILFPNGAREIWIKDDTGKGFKITAGRGPRGLGLQIERFGFGPAMTISANGVAPSSVVDPQTDQIKGFDASHVEICQYDDDEKARAYKAWYTGNGPYPGDDAAGFPKAFQTK